MANQRPRVVLIFGGQSSEHQISCLTAAAVAGAIDTDRYEVVGVGIAPGGTWHRLGLDEIAGLRTQDGVLPTLGDDRPHCSLIREPGGVVLATWDADGQLADRTQVDIAFALLHGPYGEDGTIQGLCEMLGLTYVGSGVAASAIGMDKHLMKVALEGAGLPVGPYEMVWPQAWLADPQGVAQQINSRLRYPLFVKPARGGSSVGISRVTDPAGLAAAIEVARAHDPKVVVEQGFANVREVECAVLGPRPGESAPRVSVPGEIMVNTDSAFYDFEAKYLPSAGQVDLKVPAELEAELVRELRELAAACFSTLGFEGLARVDTFIADGQIYVNEVNTIPGFTELSMFPALWQASGISYSELITDLIDQGLARPNNVVR